MTSAAVAAQQTAVATPSANAERLNVATAPANRTVIAGACTPAASAGGRGGGGGLRGLGGGLDGGGGGGGSVHAVTNVAALLPNVRNPTGHAVGIALPSSGQYVSTGHAVHVALLPAAVTVL
jgi:hypothetical protein